MNALLTTAGLGRHHRRRWALRDCSISVPEGGVAALVGPNGAGNTTLPRLSSSAGRPSGRTVSALPTSIDICQYASVSMQESPLIEACQKPLVREPLDEQAAAKLSRVFKALADPVRLRLLSLIASHDGGEACVCDLTAPFDVSQPTISHHLKVLRDADLVVSERRATWVYYRVQPEALGALADLLTPTSADAR